MADLSAEDINVAHRMTRTEAIEVVERYANELVKFKESSDAPDDQLFVGFLIPGNFGCGDAFFQAMRVLRTKPPPTD